MTALSEIVDSPCPVNFCVCFLPGFYEGSFSTAESPLLWPKVAGCTVIADPINCSSTACWDVNFGNKPRGLDMLMCPETCLEKLGFSAVYISMINDRATEKSIFKSNLPSPRVLLMVK